MTAFAWALAAAFCWGLAPLVEKIGLGGKTDPVIAVFVRSVGVTIGMICFFFFVPRVAESARAMPFKNSLCLILGGLLASIAGQLCFYRALKIGDVSRVVPIGASYPVLACLLGLLYLNEPMTAGKGAGILLVVAGTYLLR